MKIHSFFLGVSLWQSCFCSEAFACFFQRQLSLMIEPRRWHTQEDGLTITLMMVPQPHSVMMPFILNQVQRVALHSLRNA